MNEKLMLAKFQRTSIRESILLLLNLKFSA